MLKEKIKKISQKLDELSNSPFRKVLTNLVYILALIIGILIFLGWREDVDMMRRSATGGIILPILIGVVYLFGTYCAVSSTPGNNEKPSVFRQMSIWNTISFMVLLFIAPYSTSRGKFATMFLGSILLIWILSFIARFLFVRSADYQVANEDTRKYTYKIEEKAKLKKQEKEDHEENLWETKHNDLLNRGLKYYRVGFGYNKKWYAGRREILVYVEAIDKDSAVSEAKKRLIPELRKQSITECIVIAGQKNLKYSEIKEKWKERNYLGSYATRNIM